MADQAYVDLQSVRTTIDAADAYLTSKKYENAVQAYQVAGTQGQSLRHELPSSPALDQADLLDQQLQSLPWKLASPQTAQQAQNLAKQILALETQAFRAVTPTTTPTAPTPAPPSTNWASIVFGTAIAIGVGALFYLMIKGPKVFAENPLRGFGSAKKKKGLIHKGRAVVFEMRDGRDIHCQGGMMHDPSGRTWPARSVLCGPFRGGLRQAEPDEFGDAARHYLGSGHHAKIGIVHTPPKALERWRLVGDVVEVRYTRGGSKAPGSYYHPFNKRFAIATLLKGKGRVRLYRCGRFYRLQLPRGAILDERGFVWP